MTDLQARVKPLLPGLAISAVVAVAAMFLSEHYGAPVMLFALLLGMALNFLSEDGRCQAGLDVMAKQVLRLGVALLGLRITLDQIMALTTTQIDQLTAGQLGALSMAQADAFTLAQFNAMSAEQQAVLSVSPLVLDLNGDGVQTLHWASNVYFDIDADGDLDSTGWVGQGDGMHEQRGLRGVHARPGALARADTARHTSA